MNTYSNQYRKVWFNEPAPWTVHPQRQQQSYWVPDKSLQSSARILNHQLPQIPTPILEQQKLALEIELGLRGLPQQQKQSSKRDTGILKATKTKSQLEEEEVPFVQSIPVKSDKSEAPKSPVIIRGFTYNEKAHFMNQIDKLAKEERALKSQLDTLRNTEKSIQSQLDILKNTADKVTTGGKPSKLYGQ
jgi:hypothetical protein